ncbi:hypothetical protein ACFOYU_19165 [Microvirga sp. GCM10011540]|uniref:hypothetical protein n=1 Tax=Microvirga sp. GCM10011540 TaxID=3317338 RepID=UPI00360AD37F
MGAQDSYFEFCTAEVVSDPQDGTSEAINVLTVSFTQHTYTVRTGKPYKTVQAKGSEGLIHLGSAFPDGTFGTDPIHPRVKLGIFYTQSRIDVAAPPHGRETP